MVGPIKRRGSKAPAKEPVIDAEFQSRIPPMREEEYQLLKESIRVHGCQDKIKIWGGKILDGHNRFRACHELDVKYETEEVQLLNREEALDYIDRLQLGRRNLTPDVEALLRGRILNRQKTKHGGDRKSNDAKSSCHSDNLKKGNTSKRLAEEFKVSPRTVNRDGAYAAAVDTLRPIAPELEAKVIRGEGPPRKRVIEAALAAQESPEKAKEILTTKPAPRPRSKPQPPTAAPPEPEATREPAAPDKPAPEPIHLGARTGPRSPAPKPIPEEYLKYLPGYEESQKPLIDKLIEVAEPLLGEGYSAIRGPDGPWEGPTMVLPAASLTEEEADSLCANLSTGVMDEKIDRAIAVITPLGTNIDTSGQRLGLLYRLSSAVCLSPGEYVVFYIGSDPKAFSFAFLSHGIPLVSLRSYSRIEKEIKADAEATARLALTRAGVTDKEKQNELLSAEYQGGEA